MWVHLRWPDAWWGAVAVAAVALWRCAGRRRGRALSPA